MTNLLTRANQLPRLSKQSGMRRPPRRQRRRGRRRSSRASPLQLHYLTGLTSSVPLSKPKNKLRLQPSTTRVLVRTEAQYESTSRLQSKIQDDEESDDERSPKLLDRSELSQQYQPVIAYAQITARRTPAPGLSRKRKSGAEELNKLRKRQKELYGRAVPVQARAEALGLADSEAQPTQPDDKDHPNIIEYSATRLSRSIRGRVRY